MQLMAGNRAIQIQQYEEEIVATFPIRQTSFYEESLPWPEYIALDAFHLVGIVVLKATQSDKIATQSQKDTLVDYFNDNQ